jgi:dihydropteroate synthase
VFSFGWKPKAVDGENGAQCRNRMCCRNTSGGNDVQCCDDPSEAVVPTAAGFHPQLCFRMLATRLRRVGARFIGRRNVGGCLQFCMARYNAVWEAANLEWRSQAESEKYMMAYPQITRPTVMGVVNVTPDSFSDGGRFSTSEGIDYSACIEQAIELARQGAGIIDVGGEASSFHRPGIAPVPADQQIHRVVPVINGLRKRMNEPAELPIATILSVDTRCSAVAEAAISTGAQMINDISAGEHDPEMFRVIARHGCFLVMMHRWVESPGQDVAPRENICQEVFSYLRQRAAKAMAAGIAQNRILLDPGIGFGKSPSDNWRLIAGIGELVATGFPVVLGVSRKRFLSDVIIRADSSGGAWDARDAATALVTVVAAQRGVLVHRVHDVQLTAMALAVSSRIPPGM